MTKVENLRKKNVYREKQIQVQASKKQFVYAINIKGETDSGACWALNAWYFPAIYALFNFVHLHYLHVRLVK